MSQEINELIVDIEQDVDLDGDTLVVNTSNKVDGNGITIRPIDHLEDGDIVVTYTAPTFSSSVPDPDSPETNAGTVGTAPDTITMTKPDGIVTPTYVTVQRTIDQIITNYAAGYLQAYQQDGAVPIAKFKNGTEREVTWSEVFDPRPPTQTASFQASLISEAKNQHFWTDTNGAHVTDDTQDSWKAEYNKSNHGALANPPSNNPWHNILMNSLGILLRRGLLNLTAVSSGSISFYDGTGNNSTNITASFGSTGAQIGKSNTTHMMLTSNGINVYDGNGNLASLHSDNIDADHATIQTLDATTAKVENGYITNASIHEANVENLMTDYAHITVSSTGLALIDNARIGYLNVDGLNAHYAEIVNGVIDNATIDHADVNGLSANYAHLTRVDANNAYIDNATISYAKVTDLSSHYAAITNGVISNAKISYADVNDLSAHYASIQNGVINNAKISYADVNDLSAHYASIQNGVINNAKINHADVNGLSANYAHLTRVDANNAYIDNATISYAKVTDLSAHYAEIVNGVINNAKINHADVNGLSANYAHLTVVDANTAYIDNATIDQAKVTNLATNYAKVNMENVNNSWIENGVVKNSAITSAQIQGVSANKITAGTINAENVTITNLQAENIKVKKINGTTVTGKSVADALATHESDISDLDDKIDTNVDALNRRIDSQIETFTTDTVPTSSNYPASSWNTNTLKAQHVGDICYVVNSGNQYDGFTYRYAYDNTNSTYGWVLIQDNQVTAALSRLSTAEGKISNLESFESNTTTWINETDEGLTTIRQNHTTLVGRVDKTLVSTVQLWFTKANTTAPNKPSAHVTTNNAATGNAWNLAVPTYNSSYPNYYYCYEWKFADGTYDWSSVTRDIATGETQKNSRDAITNAATAQNTANKNVKESVQLWFSKANATAPDKPNAAVTSTATTGNAWTTVVPTYSTSYPYYFYCYQYKAADGTYTWSDVVYDRATTESESVARTANGTANTAKNTADKNVKESVQLWFSKANATAPDKPNAAVTSTATTGNAWTTVVPTYSTSYPYYFYCYQYKAADGTYTWSDVVYDRATTETQSVARTANTNANTANTLLNGLSLGGQGRWYASHPREITEQTLGYLSDKKYIQLDDVENFDVDFVIRVDASVTSSTRYALATPYNAKPQLNIELSTDFYLRFYSTSTDDIILDRSYDVGITANIPFTIIVWYDHTTAKLTYLVTHGDTFVRGTHQMSGSFTGLSSKAMRLGTDNRVTNIWNHASPQMDQPALWYAEPPQNAGYLCYWDLSTDASGNPISVSPVTYTASTGIVSAVDIKVNTATVETKQLWYTKANTTAPGKPTSISQIINSSSTPNQWNQAVPIYNETYPHYFYCYQRKRIDGGYEWSDVVYDAATSENEQNAHAALTQVSTKVETTTFNTLVNTVNEQSNTITSLSNTTDIIQKESVEYIESTQTSSTANWTGVTRDSSLYIGKTIAYKLKQVPTGNASLNLTLSGGGTTGAKAIYINNTRVTTHFASNSVINMTYDGTSWRVTGYWTGDTYNRTRYQGSIMLCSATTIAWQLVGGKTDGYRKLEPSVELDISYPILACAGVYAANVATNNVYLCVNNLRFDNTATVQSPSLYTRIYLKGTMSGTTFTCAASNMLTCVVPTTADGFFYIPIGTIDSVSDTQVTGYFLYSSELWAYTDGKFQKATPMTITTQNVVNQVKQTATENSASITSLTTITDNLSLFNNGHVGYWRIDKYYRPSRFDSGLIVPTPDDFKAENFKETVYKTDADFNKNWNMDNNYLAKAYTYIYMSADTSVTTYAYSDDYGALYVNDIFIWQRPNSSSFTFTLTTGWNKIEFLLNENTGADYARFTSGSSTVDVSKAQSITTFTNYVKHQADLPIFDNTLTESKVSEIKQTLDGFQTTVSSTYATQQSLTELSDSVDDIQIGGRNLYINKNQVAGYLNSSGNIHTQQATNKEVTSDYISVTHNETIIFQVWTIEINTGTTNLGNCWMAYVFYNSEKTFMTSTGIQAKYDGTLLNDGYTYNSYKITVPANAAYMRCSYRLNDGGFVKVEKGNKATDWTPAPEDLNENAQSYASTAESNAKTAAQGYASTAESNAKTAAQGYADAVDGRLTQEVNKRKAIYATCSTAAGTAAKVATCSNFELFTGAKVTVIFTNMNTAASPTLKIGDSVAKAIRSFTGAALTEAEYKWDQGAVIDFVYDGTYWRMTDLGVKKRVVQAETQISQNAEAISLRATKSEAIELAQPNLTPMFASYPYDPTTNSFWQTFTKGSYDAPTNEWFHINISANDVSGNYKTISICPYTTSDIKKNTLYTWMYEIRNLNMTIDSNYASYNYIYIVEATQSETNRYAFWGSSIDELIEGISISTDQNSPTSMARFNLVNNNCIYRFTKYSTDVDNPNVLAYLRMRVGKNCSLECDLRISVYEGRYIGPFKPYVGKDLYTSQAELKVANDAISTKVEKNGVISSINQSSESITINANRVNIEGATIFSSGRLSQTSLNNAYDAKGAASTAESNAKTAAQGYASTAESNAKTAAQGYASTAESNAKTAAQGYASTAESNAKTAAQGYASTAKSEAISSANGTTDTKLASYSTTTQMNSAIGNAVNDIQIGGRNLVRHTDSGTGWAYSTFDSATRTFTRKTTATTEVYIRNTTDTFTLNPGETYTASWYAKSNGYVKSMDIFKIHVSGGGASNQYRISIPLTTTFTKYVWTFTCNASNEDEIAYLKFDHNGSTTDGTEAILYVKDIKLEKGNKATDWTPAPEDVEASITAVENQIPDVSNFVTQVDIDNSIGGSQMVWYAICDTAAATVAKVATISPATTKFTLTTGVIVNVKFTNTNSGSTSSITLSVNGTTAKPIRYINNSSAASVLPGANYLRGANTYQFIYDGANWLWMNNYNTNYYDRTYYNQQFMAVDTCTAGRIICGTSSGYRNIGASIAFDLSYPLFYCSSTINSGTAGYGGAYLRLPGITITNNGTVVGIGVNKTVYLKGSINGNTFTIAASNFLTCNIPMAIESYAVYIPIGQVTNDDATKCSFESSSDLYCFIDGKFRKVTPTEIIAEQDIYCSKATGTASLNSTTTWVTDRNGGQNGWTAKRPQYSQSYPVLFIAHQAKRLDGTVTCTTPMIDETTTVIDGGNIITGSVTANQIAANTITANKLNTTNINASKSLTVGAFTDAASNDILNSNIEIGGRNLLLNTGYLTADDWAGTGYSISQGILRITPTTDYGYAMYTKSNIPYSSLANKTVVVSADIQAVNTGDYGGTLGGAVYAYVGVKVPGYKNSILNSSRDCYINKPFTEYNYDTWTRCFSVYTIPTDLTSGKTSALADTSYVVVQFGKPKNTCPIEIKNVKFEIGNKATDWTPAPEDVDADILEASKIASTYITHIDDNGISIHPKSDTNGTSNYAKINASGLELYKGGNSIAAFTDISARIGKANGARFNMGATSLEAYNSSNQKYFEVTATGLKFGTNLGSTVATTNDIPDVSSFVTQTDINTSINNIQISATNLVSFDLSKWIKENVTATVETDSTYGSIYKVVFESIGGSYRLYPGTGSNFTHASNETYSLSLFAKSDSANTLRVDRANNPDIYLNGVATTTTWTKYTGTITTNGSGSLTIRLLSVGTLYLAKIMLVRGDKPMDWSPDPRDISTDISTLTTNLSTEITQRKAIFAKSTTAAGTAAKVTETNTPAGFVLYTGATVQIQFTTANTATTPTLNVNGTGAKTIKSYTGAALSAAEYKWAANAILTLTYDGTYWRIQDGGALQAKVDAQSSATAASNSATTASNQASAASTSATNAANSATTASNQASAASTSATNAANSATTASNKATAASTSATNAANSATTASNKATAASTSATNAANSASAASTSATEAANSAVAAKEVMGGYTILWNYSTYTTSNPGEAYVCAFDPSTGQMSDANGWVKFNGIKRTMKKEMLNPDTVLPYNIPIYIVYRLSSASATSGGTNYMVWYDSGWKWSISQPSAVGGDWTWTDDRDIILGKFVEPSSEAAFTECEIYNPPLTSKHVTTNTITSVGANALATTANTTANTAKNTADLAREEQTVNDTRNDNQTPKWYMTNYASTHREIKEFKQANKIGVSTSATYGLLITKIPWKDASGGYPKQTFEFGGRQYWRQGTSNTEWSSWVDAYGTAVNSAKTATDNLMNMSSGGLKIHLASDTTATSDFALLDSNGLDITKAGTSIAQFKGAGSRIGDASASHFVMEAAKLEAYNASNQKYFEVSASGIKFGSNLGSTVATTSQIPNVSNFVTQTDIDTSIANIKVGGVNLLAHSKNVMGTRYKDKNEVSNYGGGLITYDYKDGFDAATLDNTVDWKGLACELGAVGFNVGDQFTSSVSVDSNVACVCRPYVMCFDSSGTRIHAVQDGCLTRNGGTGNFNISAVNNQRVSATYTWTQTAADVVNAGGEVLSTWQITDVTSANTIGIYVYAMKLEYGNVATSWNLSMDDGEYGGRNLLLGSATASGWSGYTSFNSSTKEFILSTTGTDECFIFGPHMNFEPSKTYTLSFYAKTNGKVSSTQAYKVHYSGTGWHQFKDLTLTTEYTRIVWTFTNNSTDTEVGYIRFDNNGSVTNGTQATLYVKYPKLETGYSPTDWTPAPEDVDADILEASKIATTYITQIDDNGIKIHPKSDTNGTSNYAKINASGLELYKGGNSIAAFTDTSARIGKTNAARFNMGATSLEAYNSSNQKYFEVTATGLKFGTNLGNTVATTTDIPDVSGGKNLLRSSGEVRNAFIYAPASYQCYSFYMTENFVKGDTYTCTIWGDAPTRSDKTTCYYSLYWSGGSVSLANVSMTNGKGTITFTAPNSSNANTTIDPPYINIYNTPGVGASGTTYASNITKIKLEKGSRSTDWTPAPEDSIVEYISGTHGTTATNVWTGISSDNVLTKGKVISFYMTSAGNSSAATLNLTLNNGAGPTTGAKNVRLNNSNVTTHYAQYSVLKLTYDGTYWKCDNYDSNTYDRIRWNNQIKVIIDNTYPTGTWRLMGETANGYEQLRANLVIKLSSPIMTFSDSPTNSDGSRKTSPQLWSTGYLTLPSLTFGNTMSVASAAVNKVVYVKGTISGNDFTVNSLTTVVPTTADGYVYLVIGAYANNTAASGYFYNGDLYAYIDGKFRRVTPTDVVAIQDIYYSAASGTTSLTTSVTNSLATWITSASNNTQGSWTIVRPQYDSNKPVLFKATQTKRLDGTIVYTTPKIDDTIKILPGGNLIASSVTANKLNAADINASKSLTVGAFTDAASSSILNSTYITQIDNNGIKIHPTSDANGTSNYTKIDASGLEIFKGGNSIAAFTDTSARVGKTTTNNVSIENDRFRMVTPTLDVLSISTQCDGQVVYLEETYEVDDVTFSGNNTIIDLTFKSGANTSTYNASSGTTKPSTVELHLLKANIDTNSIDTTTSISNSKYTVSLISDSTKLDGGYTRLTITDSSVKTGLSYTTYDMTFVVVKYYAHTKLNITYNQGVNCITSGAFSTATGFNSSATKRFSYANGFRAKSTGICGYAIGQNVLASNDNSWAIGRNCKSISAESFAIGNGCVASGSGSIAIGRNTVATNTRSYAEGERTIASGMLSHAEGLDNVASGSYSHVGGTQNKATNMGSTVIGFNNISTNDFQLVCGKYNRSRGSDDASLFVVGAGGSDSVRRNAMVVLQSATYISGTTSSDGTTVTSDARVKTLIEEITPEQGRNFIKTLKPKKYYKSDRKEVGFYAQEIEADKEFGEYLVSIDNSGEYDLPDYRLLDYNGFIAPLVASVQDLQNQNEQLQNEVNELKSQNQKLEERIARLEKLLLKED